jgi:tetratricopeptide (TPR) repeat protein
MFLFEIALIGCFGLLLFWLNPKSGLAGFYLEVALIIVLMTPLVIVHELAHAAVARVMQLRVFGIMLGIGKTIWSGKFLGMDWTVNTLPVGGITFVGARPVPHIRWRLFLIYLAGPASHVAMALAFLILAQLMRFSQLAYQVLHALVFANYFMAAINLFPRKVSVMTGMQGSDGWHLLRAPFIKETELTRQYVGCLVAESMQAYARNDLHAAQASAAKALAFDASSGIARNMLGIIQMARRDYRESRETFLQLLAADDAREPGFHNLLLNNVAYLNALLRDATLLPEADEFSKEAFQHLPWVPAVIGTRGTVLVEMGRYEEGIALLRKSMSLHAEKQGKALNACHVALGELRRGDLAAARKYLAAAEVLDPNCFLLGEVRMEFSGLEAHELRPAEPQPGW